MGADSSSWMAPFLLGVLSSIAASAIVFAVARSRDWIVVGGAARVRRRWRLAQRLDELGLTNFYASRSDFALYREQKELAAYLASASQRIDVAGYWMAHGHETEAIAQSLVAALERKPGLVARVALVDPDGASLGSVAEYMGIPLEEAQARSRASLRSLALARSSASASVKTRFQVLTYSDLPLASVIVLDYGATHSRIQIDVKLFRRPRSDSFALELTAPSPFFERCALSWLEIVNRAIPYETK